MNSLSQMLQVCYFSILVRLLSGYLLFAANLEDFHTIAKKLVPDNLAENLARIAAKPSMRERQESYDESVYSDESHDDNNYDPHTSIKAIGEERERKGKINLSSGAKVDFDELVERVKKRLTVELKQKYIDSKNDDALNERENPKHKKIRNTILNLDHTPPLVAYDKRNNNLAVHKPKKKKIVTTKQYNNEEMSPFHDEPDYKEDIFNKPKVNPNINRPIEQDHLYDSDDAIEVTPLKHSEPKTLDLGLAENISEETISTTNNINQIYKKVDMTRKDSYEDYVTPAKTDVYASSDNNHRLNVENFNKRYKIETNIPLDSKKLHNVWGKNKFKNVKELHSEYGEYVSKKIKPLITTAKNLDYNEKTVESDEIKAKTENLWFDHGKISDTVIITEASKISNHRTMLPTKATYKMETPNYYANLPIIVEKYNFDEPLPEKDRERETITYIANPPASINKKVRLI